MKIVNIIGGLGNQMFQYAFAVALKERNHGEEVLIDTHHYKNAIIKTFRRNNFFHNGFEIEKIFPNANLPIANKWQIAKVSYYVPNYILSRIVRRILPKRRREFIQDYKDAFIYRSKALTDSEFRYFEGYWMSPSYFDFCKETIWNVFALPPLSTKGNIIFEQLLNKDNSVTIHIRRGDYLNSAIFRDICTLDYYCCAIEAAKKKISDPMFFIFSNDQEWCKEYLMNVLVDNTVHFVTNNKGEDSYRDMQLMSLARCNILANSSFSWWGAYLNRRMDQIVFVPKKWTNQIESSDVYADSWIRI